MKIMRLPCGSVTAAFAITALLSGGTAHALPFGGPAPVVGAGSTVVLKRYEPASMELPIGGHAVTGSSFVVYTEGRQAGASMLGALFGPIGALASHMSGTAESALGKADRLQLDLFAVLEEQVQAQSVQKEFTRIQDPAGASMELRLTPKGFIRLTANDSAFIELQVQAELFDRKGDEVWKGRYHYNPLVERKLTGPQGWLDQKNEELRKVANEGIEAGLHAAMMDVSRTIDLTKPPLGQCQIGKGRFPWVGAASDKAIVTMFINRPSGTFVFLLDPNTNACTKS